MEIKNIQLKDIVVEENVRLDNRDKNLVPLMESITQDGLMQPIGVRKKKGHYEYVWGFRRMSAFKKLGKKTIPAHIILDGENVNEKDAAIMNLIENLNRMDVSPFELGRKCHWLKKEGLTTPEIAIRLGLPKNKINTAIDLYSSNLPEDVKGDIVYFEPGRGNDVKTTGRISASTAHDLSKLNLPSEKIKILAKELKERGWSGEQLRQIGQLIHTGMDLTVAIEEVDKWEHRVIHFILDVKKRKEIEDKYKKKITTIIKEILFGKIPYEQGLIWKQKGGTN